MILNSIFQPSPTFTAVTVSGLTAGFVKTATGAGGLLSTEAFGANTYIPYSSGTGFSYSANLTYDGTNLSVGSGKNIRCNTSSSHYIQLTDVYGAGLPGIGSDSLIYFFPSSTLVGYWHSGGFGFYKDKQFQFSEGSTEGYTTFLWSTVQTKRAMIIGVSDDSTYKSRSIIICDGGDYTYNFNHTEQSTPTLFIHSASQSTTKWISFTHNDTNGVISVGSGTLSVPGSITIGTSFGCNGKTAQTAYASGGAAGGTPTLATGYGFVSAAEMNAFTALVANIRLALVANGIMS
jgi:hypothetical protein